VRRATLTAVDSAITRKTVTILFCDLVESSELFDRLDPEALRAVADRYYGAARAAVERHGGTVEKYIGDAVMAVFGIPVANEDDALRAVRAAVEIRDAVGRLGLVPRIGIATGEVVAGDPAPGHAFVTGPAIVVAERLQKEAGPHGILTGDTTYRLVRDAVSAEALGELVLKGQPAPVAAWRVHDVGTAPGLARRLDTPLVGRRQELERLLADLHATQEQLQCGLVSVVAPAGAGKSRLVLEFAAHVQTARVVSVRCPRYGEGTTFRPVVDLTDELGDVTLGDAHAVAVLAALRDGAPSATANEIGLALRKLLEAAASERPLAVVLEDAESAQPGLLDLVEYLARSSRGSAILLVCVGRPELLELRPAWDDSAIHLAPLSDTESLAMLGALAGAELDPRAARRIVDAAGGNPLFAEELLRMLVDEGSLRREGERLVPSRLLEDIDPPGSVQAVLQARLDHLEPAERRVLQSASVIGQEFSKEALVALAPDGDFEARFERVAAKQLVVPAWRFGHPLIREIAYASLPKAERADLHERYAHLLDADETIGLHLYEAVRARRDLDPLDERAQVLAAEAVPHLEAAAQRAAALQDSAAAASFYGHTEELLARDDPRRLDLLIELASALRSNGRLDEALAHLRETEERAAASGLPFVAERARLERANVEWYTNPEQGVELLIGAAEQLIPMAAERRDDVVLARAWTLLGLARLLRMEIGATQEALARARLAARSAGWQARTDVRRLLAVAAWLGPTPAADGLALCDELEAEAAAEGDRLNAAKIAGTSALLAAYLGDFEGARARYEPSFARIEELGDRLGVTVHSYVAGRVELLAGAPEAAERFLQDGITLLETLGDRGGNRAPMLAFLGEALHAQGKDAQAEETAAAAARLASTDDPQSRAVSRSILARIHARAGRVAEAEALAREALEIAERTDAPVVRADALLTLAAVLGDDDAAGAALALYTAKGSVVGAANARRLLAAEEVTA
jgi:class 3 adenylate cyclase/tetratricopeptide (TPR) repeat protein